MKFERILIVEDEPVVALDLRQTLEEMGHDVCSITSSYESALMAVESLSPTLVMMDIHLVGEADGIAACDYIYRQWQLPVIFLTAYADEKTVKRAAACKPFGYLLKPYVTKELYAVLQVARSRHDSETALSKAERRLALAVEAAELGIWEWESQADQLQGDAKFYEVLGGVLFPFAAPLGAMMALVHPDDLPEVQAKFLTPGFFNCTFRAAKSSGAYAWLEMYGHLSRGSKNNQIVIGALRDISKRRLVEEKLRQASVVFSSIAEGIMVLDADGFVISTNPAFTKLTGYAEQEALGRQGINFLHGCLEEEIQRELVLDSDVDYTSSEITCVCKDGKTFDALKQLCLVRDDAGRTSHYVLTISDLTTIRATERELVYLAYHDSLTKLPNRRLLMDRLKQAMAVSSRSGQVGALLFIDMDDFKTLNDSLGHGMGDLLLQQVADRLLSCVRTGDTVARLGGDEFMVLLEQVSSDFITAASQVEATARKIIGIINCPYQLGSNEYRCTSSIGATLFEGQVQLVDELIKQADIAMYQSKKNGRNTLCFFDPKMQQTVNKRAMLEAELHKAAAEKQFQLYYQLQVNASLHAIGAEALIRWNHPKLGLVSPAEFIPLAEETGLILSIGAWVLETACAQLKQWLENPNAQKIVLAVNVSPKQFKQPDFSSQIQDLLTKYAIPGGLLKLEITEGMLFVDVEQTIQTMRHLKQIGVLFSLDDFGTGYSSLQYLKRLPLDQLKIDQSFVRDLVDDASDRAIVRTIITLAESLHLDVIAEGVETEGQRALLLKKGCTQFQGYLFSKPIPIDQFNALLK